MIVRKCFAN